MLLLKCFTLLKYKSKFKDENMKTRSRFLVYGIILTVFIAMVYMFVESYLFKLSKSKRKSIQ